MSKLPKRPDIENHRARIGLDQYDGLWITIDDELRQLVTPLGLQLNPSDFSDLYLPALQFIDDAGKTHLISIATDGTLLVDDRSLVNLNNYYTKQEVDAKSLLKAPNGKQYQLTVDNAGKLGTKEL